MKLLLRFSVILVVLLVVVTQFQFDSKLSIRLSRTYFSPSSTTTTTKMKLVPATANQTILPTSNNVSMIRKGGAHDLRSAITKLSSGTDLYENICLYQDRETQSNVLVSSHPLKVKDPPTYVPMWLTWTTRTRANATLFAELMAAQQRSQAGQTNDDETLLLLGMFENPGHCLNDLAFSLAMDMMERDDPSRSSPYYKRFVLFERLKGWGSWLSSTCQAGEKGEAASSPYCCHFMELLGFLQRDTIVGPDPEQKLQKSLCVSKLIVPRYSRHRLPSTMDEMDAIRQLQQNMFKHLTSKSSNLISEPWPNDETDDALLVKKIWLKDRADASDRKLAHATKLQQALEEQYYVRIERGTTSSKTKGAANILEQAEQYNSHRYIIEVHGASMAHLFFARPNTHVFEIVCATPVLPMVARSKDNVDSYAAQWYASFVGNLSMHYYQHVERDGCFEGGKLRRDYSPQSVTIDIPSMVKILAAQFGLILRADNSVEQANGAIPSKVPLGVDVGRIQMKTMERQQFLGVSIGSDKVNAYNNAKIVSSVIERSDGTDMYENVCLMPKTGTAEIKLVASTQLVRPKIPRYSPQWAPWTRRTSAAIDFDTLVNSAMWVTSTNETLFLLNLFANPGHCLNDLGFSLGMELLGNEVDNKARRPIFSQYVYLSSFSGWLTNSCPTTGASGYCCHLMELLGLVDTERIVYSNSTTPLCFSKLIMPRFAQHRIPSQYPQQLEGVRRLQRRMFATTPALIAEPWSNEDSSDNNVTPTIFFQARANSNRRKLHNATHIAGLLQGQYHVKVNLITNWQQWNGKVLAQAQIYNSQRYILEVHGGSTANIFFARPGTKVLEVQCAVIPPKTKKIRTVNSDNWQWYSSFAGNLSLDYYQHIEREGCLENGKLKDDYSPKVIKVDVVSFVKIVASHFGLRKRDSQ